MKIKKCPYCGKRVSYVAAYASRRKGEFVCERCGKESKVVIDKKVIIFFLIMFVAALAIMVGWMAAGLINNPLGILLVAIPFIVFAFFSPKFVNYEPLKKYKKSMEAKKEGIAYSDNLITSELEDSSFSFSSSASSDISGGDFQINTDIFNEIKAERNAEREKMKGSELISDSKKINESEEINNSTVENVFENSYTETPLKKIHSDNSKTVIRRNNHFIPQQEEIKEEQKKNETNRYSSNRKF